MPPPEKIGAALAVLLFFGWRVYILNRRSIIAKQRIAKVKAKSEADNQMDRYGSPSK